jgi:peptide/nickel transport system permease protein
MIQFLVRRLLLLILVVWGLVTVVFLLVTVLPGDPAQLIAGAGAPASTVALIRHALGLDQPLPVQYVQYLNHVIHGDFGRSYQSHRPVWNELMDVFPRTIQLAVAAEVSASLLGMLLGTVAASQDGKIADRVAMLISAFSLSMPQFWLALMLQLAFAVRWPLFPPSGYGNGFDLYIVLPAVTLALPTIGFVGRITRAALVQEMRSDYVRTARAKGLSSSIVMIRHLLPNSLIPIVTTIGSDFVRLMGGIVIVEAIFAWPGIGSYAFHALTYRDLPALGGSIIVFGVTVSLINLVLDVLYVVIDPRIRVS